jgi:hypothetical protein
MSDIFTDPASAFFKSAVSVDVGALDAETFGRFLDDKFALGKRAVDKETLSRVFAIAENVPGDVQELCAALWETTSYKETIRDTHIKGALELIHARESKGYESTLVQLTGQQVRCLVGLARMGGKAPQSTAFVRGVGLVLPTSVKKALNRLAQLKIVYRHQGEYKFVNPFFKSWLLWKNF